MSTHAAQGGFEWELLNGCRMHRPPLPPLEILMYDVWAVRRGGGQNFTHSKMPFYLIAKQIHSLKYLISWHKHQKNPENKQMSYMSISPLGSKEAIHGP